MPAIHDESRGTVRALDDSMPLAIALFAALGLLNDPPKPLGVVVPSIAELRSFVPSDLRPSLPPVDPKQDGRLILTLKPDPKTSSDLSFHFQNLASIRANLPGVEAGLKPNLACLHQVIEASKFKDWSRVPNDNAKSPPIPGSEGPDFPLPPFPVFANVKSVSKLLLVQARVDLLKHRSDAADEYLAVLRLGALFANGRQGLVGYLIGRTIISFGISAIMIDMQSMPVPVVKAIVAGLPRSAESIAALGESLRQDLDDQLPMIRFSVIEIARPRDATDHLYQALKDHPRPFDVADTIRILSAIQHANINAAAHPERDMPKPSAIARAMLKGVPETPINSSQDDSKWPPPDQLARELHAMPNPLGRLLCSTFSGFDDLPGVAGYQLSDSRALRVALVLEIYRRAHGKLPASLSDLVAAKLIQSAPLDPFDLQPFRYDTKRSILWTIGPDREDNGGHDKPWTRPKEGIGDLVYPLDGHQDAR